VATPVGRIVNASPLILLAKVGQLDLLRAGVPETIVPDAALQEVGGRGAADPVYQEILRQGGWDIYRWLQRGEITDWAADASSSNTATCPRYGLRNMASPATCLMR
jgi:hypothetical protein